MPIFAASTPFNPLQVVDARAHVLQVAVSPAAIVGVLELLAIAGAPTDVRHEHEVAALREVLHLVMTPESVVELRRRSAVNPHESGRAVSGRERRWAVEIAVDRVAVGRRVRDLLGNEHPLGECGGHRPRQPLGLARRDRDDVEVFRLGRGAERVADSSAVGRPLRLRDRAHRLRGARAPAARRHRSQRRGARAWHRCSTRTRCAHRRATNARATARPRRARWLAARRLHVERPRSCASRFGASETARSCRPARAPASRMRARRDSRRSHGPRRRAESRRPRPGSP